MIEILHRLCRVCDACVAVCPALALWTARDSLTWRPELCRDEAACVAVCPAGALRRVTGAQSHEATAPAASS